MARRQGLSRDDDGHQERWIAHPEAHLVDSQCTAALEGKRRLDVYNDARSAVLDAHGHVDMGVLREMKRAYGETVFMNVARFSFW